MGQKGVSKLITAVIRKIDYISSASGLLSGILSFLLMLLISADVLGRYFLDLPILGTLEISRLTLAWICFLGVLYAYTSDSHVRVTFFISRVGPTKRALFEVIACVIALLVFGLLTWKSWLYFWNSWINREWFAAPIRIPYWLAKLSVPVGSFMLCIAILFYMCSHALRVIREDG